MNSFVLEVLIDPVWGEGGREVTDSCCVFIFFVMFLFVADLLELSYLAKCDQGISSCVLEESIFINILDHIQHQKN